MALCRTVVAGEALLAAPSSCFKHTFDDKTFEQGSNGGIHDRCFAASSPGCSRDPGGLASCWRSPGTRRGSWSGAVQSLSVASVSGRLESVACLEGRRQSGGEPGFGAVPRAPRGLRPGMGRYWRSGGSWAPVRALGRGSDRVEEEMTAKGGQDMRDVGDMRALDGAEWRVQPMVALVDESDPSWEQINMVFRVVYAAVMYGGLALAGNVLCNVIGIDCWGGFELDIEMAMKGLGYAVAPMVAILVILEDEVVKHWPAARAIRDVEDNEIMDFFAGMSPWQFAFVVATGALSEEMFFRVAIQGGLTHALKITGSEGVDETVLGVAALTGFIPLFVPFAQGFAAFLTSSLIGSMYYIISSPKDPKYIISHSNQGKRDLKKRVEVWYERRQLRKIYSPLMEALLALYLGVEWIQTGNILAPMVTHCLYSTVVVGTGLRRIHDQRRKLRERVKDVVGQNLTMMPALKMEDME